MGTGIQDTQRGNEDRHHRWARLERADLFARYDDLHAQGVSQRQAAKILEVPRSTLQAWRAYQESLDACPAVVAFFHSVPGLACLHRLVLAFHANTPEAPQKRAPGRPPKGAASLEQLGQAVDAARQEHGCLAGQREQVRQSMRAIGHA